MKTKKVTAMAILFVFGFGSVVNAQQPRKCGTMTNQERLEKMYPGLKAKQAAIEEQTQNFTSAQARESMATVNIPVVVHVVYNTTAQNVSDAQITSQIDVLNEDYRKMNADKVNVPSAFAGVAADCNITFCLAKKDPNGNATTGIVRKYTTSTSFIDDDKVKSSTTGGDNAWDATKYLNLWVCNLGNGLLGYAQFPGGPASTDGVVILYSAFGRTGNVTAPYNKGRTATHEVGHWLNLRHIWGDASCGNDYVSDTPTQQTSNYGCPTYPHVTCSNSGDMSMNYMDYVDDACMYMFTAGQSSRMNALFTSTGARAGILSSAGCQTTTSTSTTTSSTSNVVTIGSGANTTGVVPYGTYYMDERAQIIVTKAELVAAGFTSTNKYIKSLAFHALTANSQIMNGLTIKIAHTTASSFASTSFLSGSSTPVTVYSSNYQAVSNSWNTHTFSTPFTYNGVDNLLIDICWNNASYNNNTPVYATTTTNYMTLYKRSDVSSGGLCTTTAGTQTTNRPNMKLNFSSSSTVGSTSTIAARLSEDGFTLPKDLQTNIYPNPVSGKMTLSYNVFEENADVNMEMYDLYGRKVMASELSSNIGENNTEINFESDSRLQYLQNGIYFVSLTVNGEKTVKKIMLQK